MIITPNQNFRHHKTQYEVDVPVDVQDGLGMYFVSVGWAVADPESVPEELREHMPAAPVSGVPPEPVTLQVEDVKQTMGTETL